MKLGQFTLQENFVSPFLKEKASVILTIPIVSDRLHNILSQT